MPVPYSVTSAHCAFPVRSRTRSAASVAATRFSAVVWSPCPPRQSGGGEGGSPSDAISPERAQNAAKSKPGRPWSGPVVP